MEQRNECEQRINETIEFTFSAVPLTRSIASIPIWWIWSSTIFSIDELRQLPTKFFTIVLHRTSILYVFSMTVFVVNGLFQNNTVKFRYCKMSTNDH